MHLIWSSPTENLNRMWQYMLILWGLYFLLARVISDLSCLQSQHNLLQPWLLTEPESNSQRVFATPIEIKQRCVAIWEINFAFFVTGPCSHSELWQIGTDLNSAKIRHQNCSVLDGILSDGRTRMCLHVLISRSLFITNRMTWYVSLLFFFFFCIGQAGFESRGKHTTFQRHLVQLSEWGTQRWINPDPLKSKRKKKITWLHYIRSLFNLLYGAPREALK